jgi:hypothetical protein
VWDVKTLCVMMLLLAEKLCVAADPPEGACDSTHPFTTATRTTTTRTYEQTHPKARLCDCC